MARPQCQAPSLALRPGSLWGRIGRGGWPWCKSGHDWHRTGHPAFPCTTSPSALALPRLCPCARCLADPVPCRAMLCRAMMCHRSVGWPEGPMCLANASPVLSRCEQTVPGWVPAGAGGSALPAVPLPGERLLASQVPGVLPPYLGLNKPSPDPAPGTAPVPMGPALPYCGAPPCPLTPSMLGCRGDPGHESLGVKSPPKVGPRLPSPWSCHSLWGLCAPGWLGQAYLRGGGGTQPVPPKQGTVWHQLCSHLGAPPKHPSAKWDPLGGSPCPAVAGEVPVPPVWRIPAAPVPMVPGSPERGAALPISHLAVISC